ncbi:MAG: SPOR domain-containing protein, partial [Pseudomonadota bacterium]
LPLVTADATPIKIRPTSPGGLEIPFQDMALYDRLSGQPSPVNPTLMPAAEAPQTAVGQVTQPVASGASRPDGVTVQSGSASVSGAGEGESLFANTPANTSANAPATNAPASTPTDTAADAVSGGAPPQPSAIEPAPQPAVVAAASVADIQPLAAPDLVATGSQTGLVSAGGIPIPARHPRRPVAGTPQQLANAFIATPATATPGEPRRIRRGTIATPELPLATVQQGLQVGGALGDSDAQGNLVYRNSVSQTQPAPAAVVNAREGEVEIVMQTETTAGQTPAVRVNPARIDRQADGTIEIRSPDRDIVTIRSDTATADVTTDTSNQPGTAETSNPATEPTPSLIPRPPNGAVGPSQVASLPRQAPTTANDLANINTLPPAARAPAPISRGITRGSVVNQRASAPGPTQPPVTEPSTGQSQRAVAPASGNPAPPPGEGWRVQLASVGSQEAAIREWRRYQRAHTDLLGNLDLKVQRADLGDRGIFYRVQAGVLDRDGANAVCQTLKTRGTDCLIKRD